MFSLLQYYRGVPKKKGVSTKGGYPQMVGLFQGKSDLEMDDDWGYPYFGKPPYAVRQNDGTDPTDI